MLLSSALEEHYYKYYKVHHNVIVCVSLSKCDKINNKNNNEIETNSNITKKLKIYHITIYISEISSDKFFRDFIA